MRRCNFSLRDGIKLAIWTALPVLLALAGRVLS